MIAITSLSFTGSRAGARLSLVAACEPFGSLDAPEALADALLVWADAPSAALEARVQEVLSSTEEERWTVADFGGAATLTTPTSASEIRLELARDEYSVTVTFPRPSQERALSILGAARRLGVTLVAQSHRATLSQEQVRHLLLERARRHAAWLDGLEPGYYPDHLLPQMKSAAADAVRALAA